jgi:hypothetical protein
MKLVKVLCILIAWSWLIAWVRHDYPFPLRAAVPLCGGPRPVLYDLVQLAMLVWTAIAATVLARR